MTRLEVQLADWDNAHAEAEEEKATAFKLALQAQQERILELETKLADTTGGSASSSKGKRSGWPF